MSHLTERKENDCLNCGASVQGRFCHVCGQENIEPKESFWHLLTHFVYDITHFDGKFFSTLKYLLFKPGFLSHEYLRGRRASYLHPIRMYVFTSAFFFLIFFSVNKNDDVATVKDSNRTAAQQMKRLEKKQKSLRDGIAKIDTGMGLDTGYITMARGPLEKKLRLVDSDIARLQRDTFYKTKITSLSEQSDFNNLLSMQKDTIFKSVSAYDSIQAKLPADKRDGFIARRFMHQKLHLNEKYKGDGKAIMQAVLDKFTHLFPQMLFVSLPLFALIMQLLYINRKKFYYVNHVMFSIHLYCGTFIIILAGMFVAYLLRKIGINSGWDEFVFTILNLFFWYKSMRNFYEQRRGKTILKYILMGLASLILMIIIFIFFFIFSAMAI